MLENTAVPLATFKPVLDSTGVSDKPVAVPFTEVVDPERLVMLNDVTCACEFPTTARTTAKNPKHFARRMIRAGLDFLARCMGASISPA